MQREGEREILKGNRYTLINLQPLQMVFHFQRKSREIRFDKGWISIYFLHIHFRVKRIAANFKWNLVFIQLICRESVHSLGVFEYYICSRGTSRGLNS